MFVQLDNLVNSIIFGYCVKNLTEDIQIILRMMGVSRIWRKYVKNQVTYRYVAPKYSDHIRSLCDGHDGYSIHYCGGLLSLQTVLHRMTYELRVQIILQHYMRKYWVTRERKAYCNYLKMIGTAEYAKKTLDLWSISLGGSEAHNIVTLEKYNSLVYEYETKLGLTKARLEVETIQEILARPEWVDYAKPHADAIIALMIYNDLACKIESQEKQLVATKKKFEEASRELLRKRRRIKR